MIYDQCIKQFGIESQINMAIEECGELIVELAKRDRKINGSNAYSICSEIIDVEIMINQLKLIFFNGLSTPEEIKRAKLINLEGILRE